MSQQARFWWSIRFFGHPVVGFAEPERFLFSAPFPFTSIMIPLLSDNLMKEL